MHLISVIFLQVVYFHSENLKRRGDIEVERLPRMWEIKVRSPVATDLSRKNR